MTTSTPNPQALKMQIWQHFRDGNPKEIENLRDSFPGEGMRTTIHDMATDFISKYNSLAADVLSQRRTGDVTMVPEAVLPDDPNDEAGIKTFEQKLWDTLKPSSGELS